MKKNLAILLFLLSCSTYVKNAEKEPITVSLRPGEVKKVVLKSEVLSKNDKIFCKDQEIPWFTNKESNLFFISETYFSELKPFECIRKNENNSEVIVKVIIEDRDFPSETLTVAKEKVDYSKKDIERITKETELLSTVYMNGLTTLMFQDTFEIPLNSQITSNYGTKRIFNNKKNSQHLGIDFQAGIGTPIKVSNAGKVVLAQDLFFTGNTVIIDHGLGVFTMYGHLSKILVKKDEIVNKNALIGLSGKTGRVTGPHLHWGVKVQGNWVDGNSLIQETSTL